MSRHIHQITIYLSLVMTAFAQAPPALEATSPPALEATSPPALEATSPPALEATSPPALEATSPPASEMNSSATEQGQTQLGQLARYFSATLRQLDVDIHQREQSLVNLPLGASDNRSSSLGYHTAAMFEVDQPFWVEIDLGKETSIDAVAVLPVSVRSPFEGMRLVTGYGFPKRFKIEVFSGNRQSVNLIVDETSGDLPNYGPYPYYHELERPVTGRYVRFTSTRHWRTLEHWVVALAEIMVLSQNRNKAYRKPVEASNIRDINPSWRPSNLTDMQSPLGPPVLPEVSPSNGVHTESSQREYEWKWMQIDLKQSVKVDEIRLFPSRPTDFADMPGLGFPVRYRLELADQPHMIDPKLVYRTNVDFPNPGDNMVVIDGQGLSGRYLRLTTERLMKRADRFTFTMSEIQVVANGENVAYGKPVSASKLFINERFPRWYPAALVDGYNSQNKLTDLKTWLRGLDQRRVIEAEIASLSEERTGLAEKITYRLIVLISVTSLSVVLCLGGFTVRGRYIRRKRAKLLRQQIASDLHDDIGSNLGAIALLTETAADRKDLPEDLKDLLMDVKEIASSTSLAMRDIVWLIQKGELGLVEVFERFREQGSRCSPALHMK